MFDRVILDAGPLAAYIDRREEWHAWTVARFEELPPRFITCEAVLTEALFLLRNTPRALPHIDALVKEGLIELSFGLQAEWERVSELLTRYAAVPMSLADACLVRMSELTPDAPVFTLDRHFNVYRRNGRERIPLIYPADG